LVRSSNTQPVISVRAEGKRWRLWK
jgi:hypothetical protein